jgi:hypothetical protein
MEIVINPMPNGMATIPRSIDNEVYGSSPKLHFINVTEPTRSTIRGTFIPTAKAAISNGCTLARCIGR